MTNEERNELKEQLDEVMREIEGLNLTLDKLRLKKESLQNRISGSKPQLVSTSIEYLFSRFDFELSEHFCSKATVTKAKNLLLNNGYTDINQLKGKKLSDFFTLCEGIKILSVILAFCRVYDVEMDTNSANCQDNSRLKDIIYLSLIFKNYIF